MLRGGGAGARTAMKAAGMKQKSTKKKVAAPDKQNLGLALKKSEKGATHVHVHIHGDRPQGIKQERMEEDKHEFKKSKKMKRKASTHGTKFEDPKGQGEKLERREEGKKEFKKAHKCKGAAKCKHSSHKEKGSKKKVARE